MQKLTAEGLEELRERFGDLHDAFFLSTHIQFDNHFLTNADSIRFELRAIELPWTLNEATRQYQLEWKHLRLEVRSIPEFKIEQREGYAFERVSEATYGFCGGLVFLDFDGQIEVIQDSGKLRGRGESWRYVFGSELWWEVGEVMTSPHAPPDALPMDEVRLKLTQFGPETGATTSAIEGNRPHNWALAGLICVLPCTLTWAALMLAPLVAPLLGFASFHSVSEDMPGSWTLVWVIGMMLVLPLVGGILGVVGFRRSPVLGAIDILLGFGAAALNILMQSTPPPS